MAKYYCLHCKSGEREISLQRSKMFVNYGLCAVCTFPVCLIEITKEDFVIAVSAYLTSVMKRESEESQVPYLQALREWQLGNNSRATGLSFQLQAKITGEIKGSAKSLWLSIFREAEAQRAY